MNIRIIIFFTLFFSVWCFLNYFFFKSIITIFYKGKKKAFLISLYVSISIFILLLLGEFGSGKIFFTLSQLTNYYIGILIFALPIYLIYHITNLSLKFSKIKLKFNLGKYFTIFLAIIVLISIITFELPIKTYKYEIQSDKVSREYNILHIADPQYGSIGDYHLKEIQELSNEIINAENIDFIVFTGDFIDTRNFKEEDLEPLLNFDVPVYFTLGNHEFYHDYDKILDITNRHYIVLRNTSHTFEEINLLGADDSNSKNHIETILNKNSQLINSQKLNLLLYHRPSEVLTAKNSGVDIMITGHTHGGQIFPYTLMLKLFFDYPSGLVEIDNFILYTSDGVGLWGPKMRLGTFNEVTVFKIIPKT